MRSPAPYGIERFARMERLRYIADVYAVAQAEDADNRAARRAFLFALFGSVPEMTQLFSAAFAGPETVPAELLDAHLLDRIRAA